MWFNLVFICLFAINFSKVISNQVFSNNNNIAQNLATISLMPIQVLNNSSFNSSLMESQIQEQSLLSNISLTDLQNDNNTQQLQRGFRERKRQERLLSIQTQIVRRLGISGRIAFNNSAVNSLSEEEKSLMNRVVQAVAPTPRARIATVTGVNEISSSEIFAERLQSFYPSCATPNHTDPYLWNLNSDTEMKLFYDITFPHSSQSRTQVTAVSAKLRLYKYNDPLPQHMTTNSIANTVSDRVFRVVSQGLTVSLYQYMRPLRQNRREKKRLIDSRSIVWNKRGFIEFNVLNAINYWQNNPIRNFGLFVDIEDAYGVRHNPLLYLSQMNCSVQDTPMPNLAQIYPEVNNESSVLNNSDNFPTLDLLTVEMAKPQIIATSNGGTGDVIGSRRKRLAQSSGHKNMCQKTKTVVSMSDLKLEETVLYPKTIELVVCQGFCQKPKQNDYNCRPSDHKDIEFVYLDQDSIPKIKKLKMFLPQNCQCIQREKPFNY